MIPPVGEYTVKLLSERSLERLIIAVMQLETEEGLKVQVPLDWVLSDWILKQIPKSVGGLK